MIFALKNVTSKLIIKPNYVIFFSKIKDVPYFSCERNVTIECRIKKSIAKPQV